MKPTKALIGHASQALAEALRFTGPADQVVSRHFRNNRELGQLDRAFVAETVFAALRRRRSLAAAAQSESAYSLVLATLVRFHGLSVRAVAGEVRGKDVALLERVRAALADAQPAAVQADLPDWLWARLVVQYAEPGAQALAQGMLTAAPMDLRVNAIKASREEIITRLRAEGLACGPMPYAPTGIRLSDKPAINKHPLFIDGSIEVQDEGSQLLALLVAPKRGEMVVDFCAGGGGKTLALGALMRNTGRLYAFDVSARRLAGLDPRLARSGLSNVHPVAIASENDLRVKRLAGKIDRVLVDAPCSGFGTLRRNPDLKWRFGEKDVDELTVKQLQILSGAARLPRIGGRLVFATCSVLREEGEEIAAAFLAAHPEFAAMSCAEILKSQGIALDSGDNLRLFPHQHHTDGFFAAAFERRR
ncbi:MAG: RsmB/NOP family class I SAM-dependent RNA methyltransferase [Betaproteobacteria bacterium]|nr:RsmB/NOP family class I SAM-dependent RNA methyltransferase [Betaproteobacteria bacterium]